MARKSWVGLCAVLAGAFVFEGCGAGEPHNGGCDVILASTICSPALCGDSLRNACGPTPPTRGCTDPTIYEPCDGADLGGQSCATSAFGSGTLQCAQDCHGFDTSRCSSCVPSDLTIRCRAVEPGSATIPLAADIAATETEVGMTWVEIVGGEPALHFARFGSNLEVLLDQQLAEPLVDTSIYTHRALAPVAIAPLSSGWAVAGWTELGLYLHALDAAGRERARSTVDTPAFDPGDVTNTAVRLAARPGGGPLWVWQADATAQAAIVSNDGASVSAVIDIPNIDALYLLSDAAFADGTFYVLFAPRLADQGLRVARISEAGELLGVDVLLVGTYLFGPSMVVDTGAPRAVYWTNAVARDSGSEPTLGVLAEQRLAADGSWPSEPRYTGYVQMALPSAVALGSDTFVAMVVAASPPTVAIARLDANGVMTQQPRTIATSAQLPWHRIVRRGSDPIEAWFGDPGGLYVARLRP